MKKTIIFILTIGFIIIPTFAWPGGGPSGGGPGFQNEVPDAPVDGGIVTITALAIGYGVRQARKKKEDQNNDQGAV
jgi:hypothetical protein